MFLIHSYEPAHNSLWYPVPELVMWSDWHPFLYNVSSLLTICRRHPPTLLCFLCLILREKAFLIGRMGLLAHDAFLRCLDLSTRSSN